ncbi:hypothetical protein ACFQY5_07685 [Paeniroseomonas aquatica]|uniref:hypothetical protein n=1 Tax=Paeniroseomonas aquatica TaxID=373043 RepID=UPI00361EEEC4
MGRLPGRPGPAAGRISGAAGGQSGDPQRRRAYCLGRRHPGRRGRAAGGQRFTATSTTSSGDGSEALPGTAATLARNPHVRFFNDRRGYCLHAAGPGRLETTFRAVAAVTRPGAAREDRGRFLLEAGRPGLQPLG